MAAPPCGRERKRPQPAYKTHATGAFKYPALIHFHPLANPRTVPVLRSIAATFLFVEERLDTGVEEADSEVISELIAEGQTFEAGIIEGVQNAPDPDVAQTKTSSRRSSQVSDSLRR
jgi:hypothetical protein